MRFRLVAIVFAAALSTAMADPWDDLAQKFVDSEHGALVRRSDDGSGVVIILQHPLITERIVLVVADGKPAISFQFASAATPSDQAFEVMARGGSLLTGKAPEIVLRNLRQSLKDLRSGTRNVATVANDGIVITCLAASDGAKVQFLVGLE
jgi:hypothetical protein